MTDLTEAARATRKFWPTPHWEDPDAYFAATEGYDPENVGEIYPSYQEAQAACDRLNFLAVLKAILWPSAGMVTAAEKECGLWEWFLAEKGWRVMIDKLIVEVESEAR